MKTRMMIALATLGIAMLLIVSMQAQREPRPLLNVDVPFEFTAGGVSMPSGSYEVLHVINPSSIMVRSTDRHATAIVLVDVSPATSGNSTNKLVFRGDGEKYFLTQVWTEQDNQIHDVIQSGAERTLVSRGQEPSQLRTVYAKP